jgi:hypothetical protein
MQKKQIRVIGLVLIMLDCHTEESKCMKFQYIHFRGYGDTSLHVKTEPQGRQRQ